MKRAIAVPALVLAVLAGTWLSSGTTITVDAAGEDPAGLIVSTPTRVLNTRTTSKLSAGGEVTVNTGITGAVAVAVTITITDTEGTGGYVTAWATGTRPDTSIINATGPNMTLANSAIVPVTTAGTFKLYSFKPAHLIVDLIGYFPGSGTIASSATLTAAITSYAPIGNSVTTVSGTVSNGTKSTKTVQVDVKCPTGVVQPAVVVGLEGGTTRNWSVVCATAFLNGASIQAVSEI